MIQISLQKIKCLIETDEVGADEPFVLVATVDYSSMITVQGFPVPIPSFEVVRYGPFEDVDQGETHQTPSNKRSFWSLTNTAAALNDPETVIFIAALIENDDGDPEVLRGIIKGLIAGSVFGSLSLPRQDRVNALIRDINSGLRTPTGAPNFADRVGLPQELRFSLDELKCADTFIGATKELQFTGDGGRYILTFEATNPTSVTGHDRGFKIRQVSSGRFLDAHEISNQDFSLVTRSAQNNDTQKWIIIPQSNGTSTIQQLSSGRFVDAHEQTELDFSIVTRSAQNNNSQRWIVTPAADGTATIQQASNSRFIDAHETSDKDYSLVTRLSQNNNTQRWLFNKVGAVVSLQHKINGQFIDAHETSDKDYSLVTRVFQNNDTQRWVVLLLPDGTTTIQQLSSRRHVDAHESDANDYSVVTRIAQNNTTQQWEFTAL